MTTEPVLKLHNTKTRKKEIFSPIDPNNVRMYVCGPTVYDRAHLGNARPVVVFDVLYRLLRHLYGSDHVTYARNFTDVDDKINARAAESGREIGEITAETTQWFLDDMGALGALQPNHMPRATQYIPQMIKMIEDLIAKGHAYAAEGHVLFAVDSWREGYGRLSGRSVDDMIAGARVEVAPYKKNPMDFVLWKPSSEDLPGWDSPWGRGRPGWHIECSAMSYELLGDTFDIHGGGNDLMFPHHENEIAQSCCAHPEGEFARYWLHNEMLQVEGKKMSKSLGNFFTVHDLLEQGVPGEVIRFVFLSTHYRKPMDWTEKKARQATKELIGFYNLVRKLTQDERALSVSPSGAVVEALADDLNTPLALHRLREIAKAARKEQESRIRTELLQLLLASLEILGFQPFESELMTHLDENPLEGASAKPRLSVGAPDVDDMILTLLDARSAAKSSKNFELADLIRDQLSSAGVRVTDNAFGADFSLEKDELDASAYFREVREAFASNETERLEKALALAESAGVHFSNRTNLDVAPAWRSKPDLVFVRQKIRELWLKVRERGL